MSEPCSLLWCDIETTGLDRKEDSLLELACFITDPNGDNPRYEREWVIYPNSQNWINRIRSIPAVNEMHTESGLIDDVREYGITYGQFVNEFSHYLEISLCDALTVGKKFTIAGSGVGPFDLPFLNENFPEFTPYFNYFVMDVGVIGRFFETLNISKRPEQENIKHRAKDDINDHYNEFLFYRNTLLA